jgi:hypothetical protein
MGCACGAPSKISITFGNVSHTFT